MGTRADFYVGRGPEAEWLGSIAYDGYPGGVPKVVLEARDEATFREKVILLFSRCDHATLPEDGWPWPWNDSRTTDYAYAFDDDRVFVSEFGRQWQTVVEHEARINEGEALPDLPKAAVFPDMKDRKNVALGHRSGLLIVGVPRGEE